MPNRIKIIKFHPALDGLMPAIGHEDDACLDCYAMEDFTLPPAGSKRERNGKRSSATFKIGLGFGVILPRRTFIDVITGARWYGDITGRSSQNDDGVVVYRGIVDSGYHGELKVCLENRNDHPIEYKKGDRICQIMFKKRPKVRFEGLRILSKEDRGDDGFGSTGK